MVAEVLETARISRRLFESYWYCVQSGLIERMAYRAPWLVPLDQREIIAKAREVLGTVAVGVHARTKKVEIPADYWQRMLEWPVLLDRARYAGMAMSVNEWHYVQQLKEQLAVMYEGQNEATE